jgi:protein TonB
MFNSSIISFLLTALIYFLIGWGIFFYTPKIDIDKISEKFDSTTVTLVRSKKNGDALINQKQKQFLIKSPQTQTKNVEKKQKCCKKKTKKKEQKLSKLGLFKPKEKLEKKPKPKKTTQQILALNRTQKEQKRLIAKKGGKKEVILFFKEIKKAIAKNRIYPRYARKRGVTGKVKATFTIEKNGTISQINLKGKEIFFESAKEAIKKIEPIKTKNAPINLPLRVSITLKYKLK